MPDDLIKIIAAVRSEEEFRQALKTPVGSIFLLYGSLFKLASMVKAAKSHGKKFFVHIDLVEGLGRDAVGIQYPSRIGTDGIISTRGNLLNIAKELGLKTVQRVFILDSRSIESALESIHSVKPDMVEVMPGLLPKVITRFCDRVDMPVIAGGLIESKEEVDSAIKAGASYISTTRPYLWDYEGNPDSD